MAERDTLQRCRPNGVHSVALASNGVRPHVPKYTSAAVKGHTQFSRGGGRAWERGYQLLYCSKPVSGYFLRALRALYNYTVTS